MKSLCSEEQRAKEKIKVKERRGENWHWWKEQMDSVCVCSINVSKHLVIQAQNVKITLTFAYLAYQSPSTDFSCIYTQVVIKSVT